MNNFKDLEAAYTKAETEFSNALLKQVEILATSVILSHPHVTSFCMAMGSASFGCHWREFYDENDPDDFHDRDENLDPDELMRTGVHSSYGIDLQNLLNKYDNRFCLTGYPMMIRQVSESSVTVDCDW